MNLFQKLIFIILIRLPSFCFMNIGIIVNEEKNLQLINKSEHSILTEIVPSGNCFETSKAVCTLVAEGVGTIIGPESSTCASVVESICTSLNIPLIQTYRIIDQEYVSNSGVFNLYPNNRLLSRAIADIIEALEWTNFIIIYDYDVKLSQLEAVLKLDKPFVLKKPNTDNRNSLTGFTETLDYRPLLETLLILDNTNFVVSCDENAIPQFIADAAEVGLKDKLFFFTCLDCDYLLTDTLTAKRNEYMVMKSLDSSKIKSFSQSAQIDEGISFQAALFYDAKQIAEKALLRVKNHIEVQSLACNENGTWIDGEDVVKAQMTNIYTGFTGDIIWNQEGSRSELMLQIFKYYPKTLVGKWSSITGLSNIKNKTLPELDEEIKSKTFIVTSRVGMPYLRLKTSNNETLKDNDRFEGFSVDIIHELSKILNFKYKFEIVPDSLYGFLDPITGRWNGMVGQIISQKAHIGVGDITITSNRRNAVDFTHSIITTGISTLYIKPEIYGYVQFLDPLSSELWVYIIIIFFGFLLTIYTILRISPDAWEQSNQDSRELVNKWTLKSCFWLTMNLFLGHKGNVAPKGSSTHVAIVFWRFFSLIILSAYVANLTVYFIFGLHNGLLEQSIEDVSDLINQNNIQYGMVDDGSTAMFFKESSDPVHRIIWSKMEADPKQFVPSTNEGIQRVINSRGQYAFFTESATLEYAVERNCKLRQVGDLLNTKSFGIILPHGSAYRSALNAAILKMHENGKIQQIKAKWWKHTNDCNKDNDVITTQIDMTYFYDLFVIAFVTCVAAFVIGVTGFLFDVKKVAVTKKVKYHQALGAEILFALNIFKDKKEIRVQDNIMASHSEIFSPFLEQTTGLLNQETAHDTEFTEQEDPV